MSGDGSRLAPRLAFGRCRTGKTYSLKRDVAQNILSRNGWSFVVMDLNAEWPGEPGKGLRRMTAKGGHYVRVKSASGAARALAAGVRLVIVDVDAATDEDQRTIAVELAQVAIQGPQFTVLVLPEAHITMNSRRGLPKGLASLVLRYRHGKVLAGIWADCQHPADLHRSIQDEAIQIRIFGLTGQRDFDRLREMCPDRETAAELVAAVRECGRRAKDGEPGWHVELDPLDVSPPFELHR